MIIACPLCLVALLPGLPHECVLPKVSEPIEVLREVAQMVNASPIPEWAKQEGADDGE